MNYQYIHNYVFSSFVLGAVIASIAFAIVVIIVVIPTMGFAVFCLAYQIRKFLHTYLR